MTKHHIQELILAGKSINEIVSLTGVSHSTVSYQAHKLGNPNRKDWTVQRQKAQELIRQGFDNKRIAAEAGFSVATVCNIRREIGIPSPRSHMRNRVEDFVLDFDWKAVQAKHDAGYSYEECKEEFGFSKATWKLAVAKGLLQSVRVRNFSPIWQVSSENFRAIVAGCNTYSEILSHFGLTNKGANNKTLKARLVKEGVDFTRMRTPRRTTISPIEELLTYGSGIQSHNLKKKLFGAGLLKEECAKCGLGSVWCDEPISLHLDHIDGDHANNEFGNLRILCPNCHSQTGTFAGKKLRISRPAVKRDKPIYIAPVKACAPRKKEEPTPIQCEQCGASTLNKKYCSTSCSFRSAQRSVGTDELYKIFVGCGRNYLATSKIVGISDNAIRKRLNRAGLIPS